MQPVKLILMLIFSCVLQNVFAENNCARVKLASSILNQCIDVASCQQVCLFVVNTAKYIDEGNFKGYEHMQQMMKETNCVTLIRKDNINEIFAWKNAFATTSTQWLKNNC